MYRDDDTARTERSIALINEIALLEREKLGYTATEQRLEAARRELCALQSHSLAREAPGLVTHLVVFGATAAAAFVAYTLLC